MPFQPTGPARHLDRGLRAAAAIVAAAASISPLHPPGVLHG
ncbi:hypothetical protein ACFOPN_20800 [Xanthomonas hyacinthi]